MTRWKIILLYGLVLAAGTTAMQWLDFSAMVRVHSRDSVMGVIAFTFLALGVFVGARIFASRPIVADAGNPAARAALGISGRELEVLQELASGYSNKEIAARLGLSPNTVKTHVANLFEKLDARRRTEAISKARALRIVS